jgi:tRNA nucleotidyltransferase (CCA-adding enzyme)
MEVVVTHSNVDFDALASLVAAHRLYPGSKMVVTGSPGRNVREFISLHEDIFDFTEWSFLNPREVRRLIVVDTRIADRLGEAAPLIGRKGVEVVVYDHHPPTEDDFKAQVEVCEIVGATTTLLVEEIRKRKIDISPPEATLFALGIHEDTGSLTYPTTTFRDAQALSYLMKKGANISVIRYFLNLALTPEQHRLLDESLHVARREVIGGRIVLFVRLRVKEFVDGASLVVHKLADLENVDAIFAILETPERTYLIARSRGEIDVAKILSKFGGGGHPQAASAVLRDKAFGLEKEISQHIERSLSVPLNVKSVMSSPVRWVEPETTIKEASLLMLKYGHSGFPVVENGKVVGIISRKEVDKAVHHGLSHAPVKGFMSREVITVSPEMSLYEVEKIMVERGIGRVPVLKDGKIVGIVTRSDILRSFHGSGYLSLQKKGRRKVLRREKISSLISERFPEWVQEIIEKISLLAEKQKVRVYLVGGVVRDLILGVSNLDLDIVVEGDAISFAKETAQVLGGRVNAHSKFGTAVLILPSGFHIDFATSRTEFYKKPGALPEVEFAPIKEDLGRRDFTINAMAVSLNRENFGELLDYFGGYYDLKKGKVRILHSLSFVEDPTRIFRAVRFEQKYGFSMEERTESLAREAIRLGLVETVGGVRLRDELIPILSEKTALKAVKRLDEIGALKFVHPKLFLDEGKEKLFREVEKAEQSLSPYISDGFPRWLVNLAILLNDLKVSEVKSWGEKMSLKKEYIEILTQCFKLKPRIEKKLLSCKRKSKIYAALNELKLETLVYLWVVTPRIRSSIELYLKELKDVKISLKGKDLLELGYKPSPLVGKALNKILEEKIDGKVKRKEDEVRLALKILKKGGT